MPKSGSLQKRHKKIKKTKRNNSLSTISKLNYGNLYENSLDLCRTINTDGIILDCNKSYAEQLGYSKKEIIGKSIFDHTAQESLDDMRDSFNTWKSTGSVKNREILLKRKDNTVFPVLVSASNLYDETGKLIGSNTAIRDMSEIYQARKQIKENYLVIKEQYLQLQKLGSIKDGFLAMITHELRAPFVPIINYIELLLSQKLGPLNATQKEKLEIVMSSASSLMIMLSDLLDAEKLELGQLTLLKSENILSEVIKQTVEKLKPTAKQRGITITTNLEENATCLCDKIRIEQVLVNIISNAMDFCPKENGKIWIKLGIEENYAKIIVKDNGIGIQKDKLEKLFLKFYHIDVSGFRERRGTGLGLSISRGIIENHDGKIWAESEGSNKGAEIHLTLPLVNLNQKSV